MDPIIIGPVDAGLTLQTSATKTANFQGTAIDNGSGYAPGGNGQEVQAQVTVTAADRTDGNETYTFTLEESSDNSTFTACGPGETVTAVGAVAVRGVVRKRYVRLSLTVAGTTPSVTYYGFLRPLR